MLARAGFGRRVNQPARGNPNRHLLLEIVVAARGRVACDRAAAPVGRRSTRVPA
jgi:hypothetical protein